MITDGSLVLRPKGDQHGRRGYPAGRAATMFDTNVTVVGTVLTEPVLRDTGRGVVTSFRVASNARRFDRATEQWVDGDRFLASVSCWRRLAETVAARVVTGDPVVLTGRIRTREYDVEGQRRTATEIEATAVGLDLARSRRERAPAGMAEENSSRALAATGAQ